MCGRINVSDNEGVRLLLAMLGMEVWPSRDPRFNIAPTQRLDVVQWQDEQAQPEQMKWGLIPSWAKPGKFSAPLINARSETIREKPSFRNLVKQHRVLIPINGFYEWKREGKSKQPFFIKPTDSPAMLLAGLYQPVSSANDATNDVGNDTGKKSEEDTSSAPLSQVCIVTTDANEAMSTVHHRMPVILSIDDALSWIQPNDNSTIDALMKPADNDALAIVEVDDYVNSSRNQGPQCVAPPRSDDLFG